MPAGVVCQSERFYENKISWTPRQSSFISESFGHYHSVEVIRQKKSKIGPILHGLDLFSGLQHLTSSKPPLGWISLSIHF